MTALNTHSTQCPSRGRFPALVLAALCSGLAGCGFVLSVAPVVPESGAVSLPQLVGTWLAEDGSRATVSPRGPGVYAIATVDSDGTREMYRARAGHLGNRLVLDVWTDRPGENAGTLISGHVLIFLELDGDELRGAQLQTDSTKKALRTGVLRTPFLELNERFANNEPILTAPTDSLRAALVSYMDRPGAVTAATLLRRRPPPADTTGPRPANRR